MLEKCFLTILELNWNQRLGRKRTKLNICHHMLTSSTQLRNRSFHVVERTRTSSTCQKMTNARAKRAKILFFIVKYANLWGFCCRRRRGCLSSLIPRSTPQKPFRTLIIEYSFGAQHNGEKKNVYMIVRSVDENQSCCTCGTHFITIVCRTQQKQEMNKTST